MLEKTAKGLKMQKLAKKIFARIGEEGLERMRKEDAEHKKIYPQGSKLFKFEEAPRQAFVAGDLENWISYEGETVVSSSIYDEEYFNNPHTDRGYMEMCADGY